MNNKQKGIEEKGESGQTFWGMLAWVRRHRPSIVVQENVCGAPWEQVHYYILLYYTTILLDYSIVVQQNVCGAPWEQVPSYTSILN